MTADGSHRVDRLWPEPASDLLLDEAVAGYEPPIVTGRPSVAINMVTSVDGRAQLNGTAEGLGSRADRRLMRLYRSAHDAVGSGGGTLRATGVWLRVGDDLAERRVARGRPANPTGVVIAGGEAIDDSASWFDGDEPRLLMVGRGNPLSEGPAGTDVLRAPTERPQPRWILERLAERGIGSFLLEGGPHINAAFLRDGLIDEVCWTVGPLLVGTDALSMIAPIERASASGMAPRRGTLVAVLRHEDELFLRYRFGP